MFFFKQKTAYEMRISDWSSDVCSSDLERASAWLTEGRHFIQRADVVRNRVAFRLQIIGNRPAEVRVDDVMGRQGRRWPVAARQLVRALRPCFHLFQALGDGVVDRLIIAHPEMEEGIGRAAWRERGCNNV